MRTVVCVCAMFVRRRDADRPRYAMGHIHTATESCKLLAPYWQPLLATSSLQPIVCALVCASMPHSLLKFKPTILKHVK